MIKARQLNIIQGTNNEVLGIRMLEMYFFNDVFITIGMLASTLSGFMFASLQQVTTTGFVPPEDDDIIDFFYLLTVTAGGMISMRITLVTIYANVYGQSLAIRGPTGSVTRSVDALHTELGSILKTFALMIAVFLASMILTNYVIMNTWVT